jgi:hypothetical protein
MKVMFGINWACFGTGKWWQETLAYIRNLLKNFKGPIRQLWDSLLPQIKFEMETAGMKLGEKYSEELLESLVADVFEFKGPRLVMCEWGSWVKAQRYWDPRFTRRMFGLVVMGMDRGFFTASTLRKQVALKKLTAAKDGCGAAGAKKVKEKITQELHSIGKTTLHCGIRCYAEGWALQRQFRGAYELALPQHRDYQAMREGGKSHASMLEYYRKQCGVDALKPLIETWEKLSKIVLSRLGFIVSEADLPLTGLCEGRARSICESEGSFGRQLGKTAVCMVGKGATATLWSAVGMPGLLPALLDIDRLESDQTRAFLKDVYSWYQNALEVAKEEESVNEQVKASFLGDPIPKMTMEELHKLGFASTPPALFRAIK